MAIDKNVYLNKKEIFLTAYASLDEAVKINYSEIVRDAVIQRFEYTFELFWKLLKYYLKEYEGIEANSPKSVIREIFSNKLINEKESVILFEFVETRNLTVHTYNQNKAKEAYKIISKNYTQMLRITQNLFNNIESK